MQGRFDLLQRFAVPLAESRGGVISALRELEQHVIWIFGSTHGVVWQNKFVQLGVVIRGFWLNFRFGKSRWLRIRIRIIDRHRKGIVPRPKTKAAYLLGICLARDRIRQMRHSAGMRRRSPAGETCHRQIKTAPKKMHWAA